MRIKNITSNKILISFYELGFYMEPNEIVTIDQYKVINLTTFNNNITNGTIEVVEWEKTPADRVSFDDIDTDLTSDTVQGAIEELDLPALDKAMVFNESKLDRDQTFWGSRPDKPILIVDGVDNSVEINGDLNVEASKKLILDSAENLPVTWVTGYEFRKEAVVTLVNTYATIYIESDAHIAANAKSDGSDILFTDITGNIIDFYRSYYSSSTGRGVFILNEIPTTKLYIFYGNAVAEDRSSLLSHMYLFWDFEDPYTEDKSGNNRNAIHDNHFVSTSSGVFNTGLRGSDSNASYFTYTNNALFTLQDWHISTWFYKSTSLADGILEIFGVFTHDSNYGTHPVRLGYHRDSSKIELNVNGLPTYTNNMIPVDSLMLISLNYEAATGSWKLYINGVLEIDISGHPLVYPGPASSYSIGVNDCRSKHYSKGYDDKWDHFYIDNLLVTQEVALQKYVFESNGTTWTNLKSYSYLPVPGDTFIECDAQGSDEILIQSQGKEAIRFTKDGQQHQNYAIDSCSVGLADGGTTQIPVGKNGVITVQSDTTLYCKFYTTAAGVVSEIYNVGCASTDTTNKLCVIPATGVIKNNTGSSIIVSWKYEYTTLA